MAVRVLPVLGLPSGFGLYPCGAALLLVLLDSGLMPCVYPDPCLLISKVKLALRPV